MYTLLGGALVGLAGGAFSLAVKPGWGRPQGCRRSCWIALAIVIFGGWHPLRAALGVYLFATLQVLGIYLQEQFSWFAGATVSGSTLSCDDPDLATG